MTSSHRNTDYPEVFTFFVGIGTGSLSTPMMLTAPITINPEKACCGISTRVHPHLPGLTLNQYVNLVKCPWFSGLIVVNANIFGTLSDPAPINTVVQHWLLATNHDRIDVGLLLSLHLYSKIVNLLNY